MKILFLGLLEFKTSVLYCAEQLREFCVLLRVIDVISA